MQPGGSPMVSPGGGQGNQAAANGIVKSIMPTLHKALNAFNVGSKEYKAVLEALRSLNSTFGSSEGASTVPAALVQQAMAAKQGNPASAPPPGLAAAPPAGAPPAQAA